MRQTLILLIFIIIHINSLDAGKNYRKKRSSSGISFDRYYRFDEIHKYLKELAECYPNIAKLIKIGETYEGRPLVVLKISSCYGRDKIKPSIFVEGGIHAREWISPAQILYIIKQLVEENNKNKYLTKYIDWYILPVLNPDGYEYTHTTDRFWRKTRVKIPGTECRGVDLNRNFDIHWLEIGASSDPCEEIYAGTNASSELETKALTQFGYKIKDHLKLYLTFHSAAQSILFPYGYTSELPPNGDELQSLGMMVRDALENSTLYKVGSLYNALSPASGGSWEWFFGALDIDLSFNFELPPGGKQRFDLPPEDILKVVTDTFNGVLVFAKYVIDKYVDGKI